MKLKNFWLLREAYGLKPIGRIFLISFFFVFHHPSIAQRQTENGFNSKFGPNYLIGYLSYVPTDYYSNPTKTFPLLIFLHGAGEKVWKPQNLSQLYKLKKYGPPKLIEEGKDFPFIVISPQCPFAGWDDVTTDDFATTQFRPGELVDEIIEKIKTLYRVDPTRVYITGLSMGGASTWEYIHRYPEKVAAAIPIAGWASPYNTCNLASKNVGIWAFQGALDGGSSIQAYVNQLNNCSPAPSPLAKATVYPNVGHDAWTQTYNNTGPGIAPDNIYDWLMRHKRGQQMGNQIPIVNAGPDRTVNLPANALTISGSASDADGTITSYQWSKINGPSASISGTNTATLVLSGLLEGTYQWRLTATDNLGASASDDVTVTVKRNLSTGNGLVMELYPNKTLTGIPTSSIATSVNYSWNMGAPASGFNVDGFSARWTGSVQPAYNETYTFYTSSDDGVRLWINGIQLVNNWTNHAAVENSGQIILSAGQLYDLRMEYFENTGMAEAKLLWSSASQAKEIIPVQRLFPSRMLRSEEAFDGDEEIRGGNTLYAYPVPSQEFTTLYFDAAHGGEVVMQLYNDMGTELSQQVVILKKGSNNATVDLSKLGNGCYTLSVKGAGYMEMVKIVVAK